MYDFSPIPCEILTGPLVNSLRTICQNTAIQTKPQWTTFAAENNQVEFPRNKTPIQLAGYLHAHEPVLPILHEECFRAQRIFFSIVKGSQSAFSFSAGVTFFKPKVSRSIDFLSSVSTEPDGVWSIHSKGYSPEYRNTSGQNYCVLTPLYQQHIVQNQLPYCELRTVHTHSSPFIPFVNVRFSECNEWTSTNKNGKHLNVLHLPSEAHSHVCVCICSIVLHCTTSAPTLTKSTFSQIKLFNMSISYT